MSRIGKRPIELPSTNTLARRYDGEVFVIVVSSLEDEDLRIAVSVLPDVATADVLFEDRTLPLIGGRLEDEMVPLGVHVYRVIDAP